MAILPLLFLFSRVVTLQDSFESNMSSCCIHPSRNSLYFSCILFQPIIILRRRLFIMYVFYYVCFFTTCQKESVVSWPRFSHFLVT